MTTMEEITIHNNKNIEKQIEKHMGGCMSGFFNIFDRSHLLSGKRLYPKRLPPPPVSDSASEPVSISGSPALSTELRLPVTEKDTTPVTPPPNSPSPASPLDFKEAVKSPWKFTREAPRLSLDSRAIADGKGGLKPREIRLNTASNSGKPAPSVIARLMGLEPLPCSGSKNEPEKKSELRRSASESRSRDYRFIDAPSFLSPVVAGERKLDHSVVTGPQNNEGMKRINHNNNNNNTKMRNQCQGNNQRRIMLEGRSYYDTTDFFPAEVPAKHNQQAVTVYGEIERRLRMKGMDEPSKDLETLKHILEALQLKGLLHSSAAMKRPQSVAYNRRFFAEEESPIVLMKPARPTSPTQGNRRRNHNVSSGEPSLSPRRQRPARSAAQSPGRSENRCTGPTVRRKGGPLSVETRRKSSHSPVQSPRLMRRSDHQTVNRSPRSRRPTAEIYQGGPTFADEEVSTVSASSFSTSSYTDNKRWRLDEYRDGRNLLERCGKLLHNIAEITANSNSNSNSNSAELQQPSPVSVLDSSFYKEDESSPSPVKKRTIDFKDQAVIESEDGLWSPSSSTIQSLKLDFDIDSSEDSEFSYVSEVVRASNYLPDDTNLFFLLEKQSSIRGIGKDKSKASILQRKLIYDTVVEILDHNRQLPPWKVASTPGGRPMLEEIWSEFKKIRERGPSEDLFEVICGVLKKDLSRDSISGWSDYPVEMSDVVLDIERLVFKDLIGEIIRDLATLASNNAAVQALCRKLVF